MAQRELIQIDLDKVLKSKMGKKARYVPGFLLSWLKRTICQDQLNDMLRRYYPKTGAAFSRAVLEDLNVSAEIENPKAMPPRDDKRVIFVCNHPLGGFDGIALIALLSDFYQSQEQRANDEQCVKFVVNDILMAVEPLRDVFLPINKHGRQNRKAIDDINASFEGDNPVLVFPAGLVSRMDDDGNISDLRWNKMFVAKAAQYKRDVVPLYFEGENSPFFYKLARRRKRFGVKFNVEMLYLPREFVRTRGKKFSVRVGKRIPWEEFANVADPMAKAQEIKTITYSMKISKHE